MKVLESRGLTEAELAQVLAEHQVDSLDEIPADAEIVVGTWDEILADGERRVAEFRSRPDR